MLLGVVYVKEQKVAFVDTTTVSSSGSSGVSQLWNSNSNFNPMANSESTLPFVGGEGSGRVEVKILNEFWLALTDESNLKQPAATGK